jgi:hypothetical protein
VPKKKSPCADRKLRVAFISEVAGYGAGAKIMNNRIDGGGGQIYA